MILENIKTILLDIEGTSTPIDFVHKTLFPYARKQMHDFLTGNFKKIQTEIRQLKNEHAKDIAEEKYAGSFDENFIPEILAYTNFLIDNDRKSRPLKSLQGKIWQKGYESGELRSEVYEDVPRAFRRWASQGKTIAIFSSGSVLAQKLLFANTNYGDLTKYISAYFDTGVGGKKEAESYLKIASTKSFPQVENFLFISDIEEELDAANEAGMQTILSIRPGNAPLSSETKHQIIHSFDEVK